MNALKTLLVLTTDTAGNQRFPGFRASVPTEGTGVRWKVKTPHLSFSRMLPCSVSVQVTSVEILKIPSLPLHECGGAAELRVQDVSGLQERGSGKRTG